MKFLAVMVAFWCSFAPVPIIPLKACVCVISVATGPARYSWLPWGCISGGNSCCNTRVLGTIGQFDNKAVLNRQDEEVPDQEEQDEVSETEAEEEEEFCAGKSLWEAEESLNSQLHMEIAVKVKSRAF